MYLYIYININLHIYATISIHTHMYLYMYIYKVLYAYIDTYVNSDAPNVPSTVMTRRELENHLALILPVYMLYVLRMSVSCVYVCMFYVCLYHVYMFVCFAYVCVYVVRFAYECTCCMFCIFVYHVLYNFDICACWFVRLCVCICSGHASCMCVRFHSRSVHIYSVRILYLLSTYSTSKYLCFLYLNMGFWIDMNNVGLCQCLCVRFV